MKTPKRHFKLHHQTAVTQHYNIIFYYQYGLEIIHTIKQKSDLYEFTNIDLPIPLNTHSRMQVPVLLRYLVDEADGWGLASIQEVNIDDLQLLESDVEGLELTVVPIQGDHLEQPVIQPQANHTAFWVYNSDNTRL